jgi:hypothetical protein
MGDATVAMNSSHAHVKVFERSSGYLVESGARFRPPVKVDGIGEVPLVPEPAHRMLHPLNLGLVTRWRGQVMRFSKRRFSILPTPIMGFDMRRNLYNGYVTRALQESVFYEMITRLLK